MPVNSILLDGVIERLALRYDDAGRPELRCTVKHTKGEWPLYVPACAVGATAERLAQEVTEGDYILITSGQLCYRKRATKGGGDVSRLELLMWAVEVLRRSESPEDVRSEDGEEGDHLDDPVLVTASPPVTNFEQIRSPKKARRPNANMSKFGAGPA
jgi:hypothetical protein